MDPNTFPTKGNLIAAKNSLKLATMGYGLMDKKRNILIRELMGLIDEAKGIQSEIDTVFKAAYEALQSANIELGINYVQEIGMSVPVDDTVKIKARSIMGTEIPLVQHQEKPMELAYGFNNTSEALDIARERFERVKELTIKLSMVENSAYRLANSIKKTQKRANALKNITIPHYEELSKSISNALEEKEREETFESLRKYMREEAEEAVQAVDKNDMENLCEELGDVLFQVMLNSQIAKEKGLFSIDDVIGGICEKMVRRHPWVFGGEKINSTEEGEALWARIKMQEKAKKP